ncbi:MAG: tRNA 4-thiouridine(8) synthase ThiI [Spirochaetaceae bacterium]|nr:tRNA 4-thiouridine(8) synthase ThiI [Spirochaetaceae bacterium]
MKTIYLLKTCEINLKGENKSTFERKLFANIRKQLDGIKVRISGRKGRFFLAPDDNIDEKTRNKIEKTLSSVFGLTGFSIAKMVEKNMEEISKTVLEVASKQFNDGVTSPENVPLTFKITARRSDKSFKYSSYELSCILGGLVLDNFKTLKVNLKNPDFKINVEIRDKAVVYSSVYKSPGGLPSGISGKAILLLSGGIDSPVAGYMMAKRGCAIEALHFETYPYTSEQSKEKVIELAKKIRTYLPKMKLYFVPFTELQVYIKQNCKQEEITLFSRAVMMKIAHLLAEKIKANSIVTGEALSQVASQTAENIRFTGSHTTYPLFRPLIGMDKQEIITKAKEIGTYEISVLPYPDCCSVFAPPHPVLKPVFEKISASFNAIEMDALIEDAFAKIETLTIT